MVIRSGLGSSLGMAPETAYGTYVAPTRWHEVEEGYPFRKMPNFVQSKGLAAGALVGRSSRRVMTHESAEGQFTTEVTHKEFGRLLNQVFGGTVAPVQQGVTTAYLQTHTLQDNHGKSATLQIGVPDTSTGTARPHTFLGSKVKSLELSCEMGGLLLAAFEWDCRQFTEDEPLAAASYTSGLKPFHFAQGTVKLGTHGAEAAVSGVRKLSVKIERPMNLERQYFGQSGLKKEPILNAANPITGSAEVDYELKGDFADRFHGNNATSLVWEFVGDEIDTGENETFRITIPSTYFTEGTPVVEGPDIVKSTFNFEADDDETNEPITVEYKSADVSL